MYYYSKSTGGFYTPAVHGAGIPSDAVQITDEEHTSLLKGQAVGKIVQTDSDGKPFAAYPTYTLAELRVKKLGALAAYRYSQETAGITVGGVTVRTDRESQALLSGAVLYSDKNPDALIDWKGANGWVEINRVALLAAAQAVGTHVQACFTAERLHSANIAALTSAEEINSYDFTTNWK